MKRLLILYLILFPGFVLQATSVSYKAGDTLFVWATQGIQLRKAPDFNSAVITKLSYGEKVIVKESDDHDYEYEITKAVVHKGLNMPRIYTAGRFVKINYKGKEGFIFDGLLSKLPPLNQNEGLEKYFERAFGRLKVIKDIKRDNSEYNFKRIVYKNGAVFQEERGSENSWSHLYLIPDIALNEGYLLVNHLKGFEESYKSLLGSRSDAIETHPIKFEKSRIVLQSGPFEETIMEIKSHYLVITMEGGN